MSQEIGNLLQRSPVPQQIGSDTVPKNMDARMGPTASLVSIPDRAAHDSGTYRPVVGSNMADKDSAVRSQWTFGLKIVCNRASHFDGQRQHTGSAQLAGGQADGPFSPVEIFQLQSDDFTGP